MRNDEFDAVFFVMSLLVAFGAGWVLRGLCDAVLQMTRAFITFLREELTNGR